VIVDEVCYKPISREECNLFFRIFPGQHPLNYRVPHIVKRKPVQRLVREMGLEAIYPKPRLSQAHPEPKIYPYLLRDIRIGRKAQVWVSDITYIPLSRGFAYIVAIVDWWSRYGLAWNTSTTLDMGFYLAAPAMAFEFEKPEIFNSDQGSQFPSNSFATRVKDNGIDVSMDGRGRAFDNIFVERLWRTVKMEWMHESLSYKNPYEPYF